MKAKEAALDDKKNIVSIRINNADRDAVRVVASRLLVRESELYRFAVHYLLNRLHRLYDYTFTGSDLLPLFLEFREELNAELGLKSRQLFEIFNSRTLDPKKFVPMSDVELLLLPQHMVRQRLQQIDHALAHRHADTDMWLKKYFFAKYPLAANFQDSVDDSLSIDKYYE